MKTRFLALLFAGVIAGYGCAAISPVPLKGQPLAWDKPGLSDEQKRKDQYECEKDAQLVSQRQSLTVVQSYLHQLTTCYEMKGYTVIKRQE
jgi:hypothetical protein